MKHFTEARPYATAAFLVAKEKKQLASWHEFLLHLGQLLEDAELKALIKHPKANYKILVEVLSDAIPKTSVEQRSFLLLLGQQQRFNLLPEIYTLFVKDQQKDTLVREVQLYFAETPEPSSLNKLEAALKIKFASALKITVKKDPSLLSGVVLHAGDMVIDASLKGQLAKLKNELMAG